MYDRSKTYMTWILDLSMVFVTRNYRSRQRPHEKAARSISMTTTTTIRQNDSSRRGFIGKVGTLLFASAAGILVKSRAAYATHGGAPSPCVGYGECHCCPNCGDPDPELGCRAFGSTTGCWYVAQDLPICKVWKCCDYPIGGGCICRTLWCNCC